ncbi:MAG: 4-hydroxy-2-oxovalerate aldolase [Chthoniobacterales bacterium]|nr:4-hydroxy-2-oxovalerate aldolase [Chthoniobacterales bacterium]
MKAPRVVDTTLRDGSHAMRHQFTRDQVRQIVRALDGAGVPVIEVSHGDGLGGSSVQYGISHTWEMELIEEARASVTRSKVAALLLPGVGTRKELKEAVARGVQMVRVATQCTEADVSEQHFGMAKEMGLETAGFLMMSHMRPPEFLAEQARLMESYGCDCVYVVDSAGALLPESAAARVRALKGALTKAKVGFHAHNNLGLGIGNTLAALEAGADWVDGTLRGLGAGAGNAATEVLAAVLDKLGCNPGLDVFRLLDAAEFVLAPMMPFQPIPDRDAVAIGYAGVYSTFLLHAKRLGEKYGVDPLAILVELGRRKTMAGQEDMILDVALDLSAKAGDKPA